MNYLKTLNKSQRAAATWDDGPLLVLAGPGSGKTKVLTAHIAQLIESTPNEHFRVLGLTFTNSAATEMRQRIAELVPTADERTLLTTFHSFAAKLLRQHGHHIGLRPDFTILGQDADRQSLLNEAMVYDNVGDLGFTSERLLPLISKMIEVDIAPQTARLELKKRNYPNSKYLASVYQNYRLLMLKKNSLDFVGLIAEALGLLKKRAGIKRQVQMVYPYICVDEFQDTNISQYRILCQLVNSVTKNIFVADDDQIIYQWNGASPARIQSLIDDFKVAILQLPENYRCPPAIVEMANELIVHNLDRLNKKKTRAAQSTSVDERVKRIRHFDDFNEEADWVARDIAKRTKSEREKCVVLARSRKLLNSIIEALAAQDISGYLATRKDEFESAALQWLHSMLRLANSRNDTQYLKAVCKSFLKLTSIEIDTHEIIARAGAESGDYLRSWRDVVIIQEDLFSSSCNLINQCVSDLSDRLDFAEFITVAFRWLDGFYTTDPNEGCLPDLYYEEKETWKQLVSEISSEHGSKQLTLHLLLQELDLRSKATPPPRGAVPCFTIHASKGKEFGHVYLIGLVEDHFPSWAAVKRGDDSPEMQEERRNCFVAITRAQESLTITYSATVHTWPKKPSRFLREMHAIPH